MKTINVNAQQFADLKGGHVVIGDQYTPGKVYTIRNEQQIKDVILAKCTQWFGPPAKSHFRLLTLKEQIQEALKLPEAHFDRHETDLYVKSSPEVLEWLKANYEFFSNVQRFTSQIDGTQWLDIPFAAWSAKYKSKA